MVLVRGTNPSLAYVEALKTVIEQTEYTCSPRGLAIYEILNLAVTIDEPSSLPIVTHDQERNKTIEKYTEAEFALYDSGELRASKFAEASKFWLKLANPNGSVNSAYGHLIFYDASCGWPWFEIGSTDDLDRMANGQFMRTPWDWAKQALISDPDSRQAILKFHKRAHLWVGNKDQPCTIYAIFHIRRDRLLMTTHMRSQDLVLGMVYDIPWFCHIQARMVHQLNDTYPKLTVGTYTHVIDSAHIYERNLDTAKRMAYDYTREVHQPG